MRYGIGRDTETDEFLIEDHEKHHLIARGGQFEPLRELIAAANSAAVWHSPPTRIGFYAMRFKDTKQNAGLYRVVQEDLDVADTLFQQLEFYPVPW